MKIAHVTATLPPYFGGMGNVCHHNAIELKKLGHDVTVFTANYKEHSKKYKFKGLKPLFKIGNAPCLPGLLKIKGFDIVHLHLPFYFGAEIVYMASKLHKFKYVVTYQMDTLFDSWLQNCVKIHNKTVLRLILNNSSKIIVSSLDYAKNSIICDVNNLTEVPNGVDAVRFKPTNKKGIFDKKYGIKNEKIVLFVGGLDKPHFFKGVNVLIDAFKDINAKLVIVGDGDLKESYMERAKKVGDKVIFASRVSDEELPLYYSGSDLLVLPSVTKGEAFGLVLVEAMASGKCVLASNLPGVRSVVVDKKLLVKPNDVKTLSEKISYLLKNDKLRESYGKKGRKKVLDKYTWAKIALQLEKIYEEVLKGCK